MVICGIECCTCIVFALGDISRVWKGGQFQHSLFATPHCNVDIHLLYLYGMLREAEGKVLKPLNGS